MNPKESLTDRDIFNNMIAGKLTPRPPIWFMRQAGRYHSHYQSMKISYTFEQLCKQPQLAAEVAWGPVDSFDFDAAILFSDILFPLEAIGMELRFAPGPQFSFLIQSNEDLKRLKSSNSSAEFRDFFGFQSQALKLTRERIGPKKGLIGFVGSPVTLFCFARWGSHKKVSPQDLCAAIRAGDFASFWLRARAAWIASAGEQLSCDIDAFAIFDSCAGEIEDSVFDQFIAPVLKIDLEELAAMNDEVPFIYYSRGVKWSRHQKIQKLSSCIKVLGVDESLCWSDHNGMTQNKVLQGNYCPQALRDLSLGDFQKSWEDFFKSTSTWMHSQKLNWICGLGHGVLPLTPEANVKFAVEYVKGEEWKV